MLKKCIFCLLLILLVHGWSNGQDVNSKEDSISSVTVIAHPNIEVPRLIDPYPSLKPLPPPSPFSFSTLFYGRVDDLPSSVEVVELNSARATPNPGSIATNLNQQTGLQLQTTTATPNAAVLRIRGLNGRYTQLLRDGFPVYGGLGSNFDFLQVSPIELKQIEILKGPAATFYGGGAGGGAVNLISRNTRDYNDVTDFQINASNIGAKDIGIFIRRKATPQLSFSNSASVHLQSPYDPNRDGFTDVPQISRFRFNPRINFYPDSGRLGVSLGATLNKENRRGGDRDLVKGSLLPIRQNYQEQHATQRIATQLKINYTSTGPSLELRNSQAWYTRNSTIRELPASPDRLFAGKQFNSYTDLNAYFDGNKNDLRAGLNFNLEDFGEDFVQSSIVARDQQFRTFSVYAVDQIELSEKLSLDGGIRAEYVSAVSVVGENGGELFVLPRLNALFKPVQNISLRVGGSSGYRMPSIFSQESEILGYRSVLPVNFSLVRPERTWGGQAGINYFKYSSYDRQFSLDLQAYYNLVNDLILLQPLGFATAEYLNYDSRAIARGLEARLRIRKGKLELDAGYALNDTYLQDSVSQTALTLVPKHSIKGSLTYRHAETWRFSINGNWLSSQWLLGGLQSPNVFLAGVTAEKTIEKFTFYINASNLFDTRQSKDESMLTSPYNTPQFTQVWGPLDGFYFNGGIRITL